MSQPQRIYTERAKHFPRDSDIATELDSQFMFYRIGHCATGSSDENTQEVARNLGFLIAYLDE